MPLLYAANARSDNPFYNNMAAPDGYLPAGGETVPNAPDDEVAAYPRGPPATSGAWQSV